MKFIQRFLGCFPHLSIIWTIMLLTFLVTDRFNTAMAFIDHPMTKRLLVLYLLCDLICILRLIRMKEKRTKALRLALSLPAGLTALAAAILLAVDHMEPARLLFTFDIVKGVLALLTLTALSVAVLLIVCQRRAAVLEPQIHE